MKRYRFCPHEEPEHSFEEDPKGEWVRFDDLPNEKEASRTHSGAKDEVLPYFPHLNLLVAGVNRVLAEPHGCRFCDSGKLRKSHQSHDDDCGFLLLRRAVEIGRSIDLSDLTEKGDQ